MIMTVFKKRLGFYISIYFNLSLNSVGFQWERSHMTSAAEGGGGGGFEMLTVADKGGGRGSKPC